MAKWKWQNTEEKVMQVLMLLSFGLIVMSLLLILFTILSKGLPALSWEMISQTPKGGFYFGKEGGILNAIVGSLYLALGGTFIAFLFGFPLALLLNIYSSKTAWADLVRLSLDILWGVPSIVYGAFGFTVMIFLGWKASLLGGILTLALLELPIMTRAMDEVIRRVPPELPRAAYALGSTNSETAFFVITRQVLPGLATAVLLAFGRGIGDAASVLFTAGYTDRIPDSLFSPVASLPLAVFFQLGTPFPEVQQRAYAAALILTLTVLGISIFSRGISYFLGRHSIR
ncbi:MAG: PstA family ABC transporter permease [Anaerolineales bacterium]|nr:phosphate ABC transporter permease PstA [Anaerolineales bacterium]MCS7247306.1 phosphate ABC transporter permease PstA [Anaerolineales bacterium]MDW8161117.1 PstA family ABC transporter permease [Anaerolineales bacterium]MDW8446054.1 PstA family ABC transporter permease [Anaerolineales bacterium]